MIKQEKLDFWVKHNYNVLFTGLAGCGKTATVLETFKRNNINYKYFSAPTLDPFTDLVGVPTAKTDAEGKTYLDFIMPRDLAEDKIEAIFIDELNRAKPKTLNALMELIQFKTINGRKFNNLRMIWAAINPSDSKEHDYNVEALDEASRDRFQVHVDFPYVLDVSYFKSKYDKQLVAGLAEWWKALPQAEKLKVSPRRAEYALDILTKGGDVRDVIPSSANVSALIALIKVGPYDKQVEDIFNRRDKEAAYRLLINENDYNYAMKYILDDKNRLRFFLPLLTNEKLTTLLDDNRVLAVITDDMSIEPKFSNTINSVLKTNANRGLCKKIHTVLNKKKPKVSSPTDWQTAVLRIKGSYLKSANEKNQAFSEILEIPMKEIDISMAHNYLHAINNACAGKRTLSVYHARLVIENLKKVCAIINPYVETKQCLQSYGFIDLVKLWDKALVSNPAPGLGFNSIMSALDQQPVYPKITT